MTFTASGGLRAIPSCSAKRGNEIKTKAMAAIEGSVTAYGHISAMPKAASAAIARAAVSGKTVSQSSSRNPDLLR